MVYVKACEVHPDPFRIPYEVQRRRCLEHLIQPHGRQKQEVGAGAETQNNFKVVGLRADRSYGRVSPAVW
jgi:hypothetical protein